MPNSFSIHSPKPSDDGERVYFTIEADGAKNKGYVSRSALDELRKPLRRAAWWQRGAGCR
ncbi:hypothetical protein [Cupriavidus necator]